MMIGSKAPLPMEKIWALKTKYCPSPEYRWRRPIDLRRPCGGICRASSNGTRRRADSSRILRKAPTNPAGARKKIRTEIRSASIEEIEGRYPWVKQQKTLVFSDAGIWREMDANGRVMFICWEAEPSAKFR